MSESVRVAPQLRACLEVLRDAGQPMRGRDVLDRVAERVELSDYEREPFENSGQPRWANHLQWHTGDSVTVSWMSKRGGMWSLTEAGESALDTYDAEELARHQAHRRQKIDRHRVAAAGELGGADQLIVRALSVMDPGSWTAYDDLAEIAGATPGTVTHFLAGTAVAGAHRVMHADGALPSAAETNVRYRKVDVGARLRSEGVEFDQSGHASLDQRVAAARLRERLDELGDPAAEEPPTRRAWLIRGSSVDGHDLVPVWLQRGSASVAAANLRRLVPPAPRAELKPIVDEDYQHKSYAARETKLAEFDAFGNRMRPGDHVLTTTQGKVYAGRVAGVAEYVKSPDNRSNLRRPVDSKHRPEPRPSHDSQTAIARAPPDFDQLVPTYGPPAGLARITAPVSRRSPAGPARPRRPRARRPSGRASSDMPARRRARSDG